jgi:hypothetical protein
MCVNRTTSLQARQGSQIFRELPGVIRRERQSKWGYSGASDSKRGKRALDNELCAPLYRADPRIIGVLRMTEATLSG